jgi:hypothetical protein
VQLAEGGQGEALGGARRLLGPREEAPQPRVEFGQPSSPFRLPEFVGDSLPQPGVPGRQLVGVAQRLPGRLELPLLPESNAEVEVGQGEILLEPNGFPALGDGLVQPALER